MEYKKSVFEEFGPLYFKLSKIKIQNVEQCEEWLNFYRWYHDLLKNCILEKNNSQDLTRYSEQHTWTYLKLLCDVEHGYAGFNLKATDVHSMDRVPFLGRVILEDNRETSMYLFANSFDYFLKQNIFSVPDEERSINENPVSSYFPSREIYIDAKSHSLPEIIIEREFMKLYGDVVDNILNCHKNDTPSEVILSGLRGGIINRQSTENLTGVLDEAKEVAVKMLKRIVIKK